MSLDRKTESVPVRSVDDLVAVCVRAEKPVTAFRVGMEHERLGVLAGTVDPVPYEGRRGIAELLGRFERFGYKPFLDAGRIIAVEKPDHTLSLEPGGQFELSGRPFHCAHDCRTELLHHGARARAVGHELGIRWLQVGYRPFGTPADARWVPKSRYGVMRSYLPTRGKLALDMMTMTTTVQASYDFSSEEDMATKMRTAMSVSPVVTAMFADSFMVNGKDSGMASYRYSVWTDVDPDRCGLLPFVFEPAFGYRRYIEWALDVPMFFVIRDGAYLPAHTMTFRQFMSAGLGPHRAMLADWDAHLSTLFPEVRLKTVIEVRGADAGEMGMNAALPALWKGLLYDPRACAAAWDLLADLSFEERLALQVDVARRGLAARCRKGEVLSIARQLLAIAAEGLRAKPCPAGHVNTDDRPLLEPIAAVLASGKSPAEAWRARWEGDLHRDPVRYLDAIAEA